MPVSINYRLAVLPWLIPALTGFVGHTGLAQPMSRTGWNGQVELGGWAASGQVMPFWLRVNQNGTIPLTTPAATLRADFQKPYAPTDTAHQNPSRQFDWTMGVEVVGNADRQTQILLPELYGKVRWKTIELALGRWRQLTGLGDSTLSSGFINGSGNAIPIPKVQLATSGYVPLGFTHRFVAISAGYAHGWFAGAYIQGSYLHQKYLYLRLGKSGSRFKSYLGINHEVQWAGQADYLKGSPLAIDGKLPSQFRYYPDVVLGLRPADLQSTAYTSFDGTYWFGNGLGSTDLGVSLTTATGSWLLYHQHIYEDLSGLLWLNVPDGLTGLSWHRHPETAVRWLGRVVVEYLSTMDQSGSTFEIPGSRYQGADNYFNHGQYIQGWSYLGHTIGTPFIMPQSEVLPAARTGQFFSSNRLKMLYAGAMGTIGSVDWAVKLAYSRQYGSFVSRYPAPLGQLSMMASVQWQLPRHTRLTLSLATDRGQLLPTTVGGYAGLRKQL